VYYTDSAFDSTIHQVNKQDDDNSNQSSFLEKSVANYLVKGIGQQCREFIATQDMDDIETLLDDDASEKEYPVHEIFTWYSLKNPRELLRLITHFCMFFAVLGGFALIFIGFVVNFNEAWLYNLLGFVVIPLFIFFTGQYAIKKNWVKDKNNTLLNRRTGLVTFTWKGERVSQPFHEFAVAIRHNVIRSGVRYHLFLHHNDTGHFCMEPGGQTEEWRTEIEWEILQQYMDTSQPLPDIPRMECFRDRDPFTAEWDKKTNRPQNYWRDIPLDDAFKMHDKSLIAAQAFTWGETREKAIQDGWQPSGMGEGDWQTKQTKDDAA